MSCLTVIIGFFKNIFCRVNYIISIIFTAALTCISPDGIQIPLFYPDIQDITPLQHKIRNHLTGMTKSVEWIGNNVDILRRFF